MGDLSILTYVSRSGSTLLARLLDGYDDVAVSLEADLPDGVVRPPLAIRRRSDVEGAVQRLFEDDKFRAWGLDRETVAATLRETDPPVRPADLVRRLLELHLGSSGARILVYKCGTYLHELERARLAFPGLRFVHVLRDPRAVYNSRKKSLESRSHEPMARNPLPAALEFRKLHETLCRHEGESYFHLLRYEDLVLEPEREMKSVLGFLGSRGVRTDGGGDYQRRIPASQQHLHTNVARPPQASRIDAWSQELDRVEIRLIQSLAGRAMRARGYEMRDLGHLSPGEWVRYLRFWLRFLVRRSWHYGLAKLRGLLPLRWAGGS